MNLEKYEYQKSANHREYEFYSSGPKGNIRKIVRFKLLVTNGVAYFNLVFGDWDEEKQKIDDIKVTNNGDTEKILLTVAIIVLDFMKQFPDSMVFAEGSNIARTRRYQMGINKLWNQINMFLEVYGLCADNTWMPFHKNANYEAFLIRRKKNVSLYE